MKKLLTILLLIFVCSNVYAEKKEESKAHTSVDGFKLPATVKVNIDCNDESRSKLISTFVKMELRSLGDVEIVEENPEWVIYANTMQLEYKSGLKLDTIFIEWLILKPFSFTINAYRDLIKDEKAYNLLSRKAEDLYEIVTNQIILTKKENLQTLIQQQITEFDTILLERKRMILKNIQEGYLEDTKKTNRF